MNPRRLARPTLALALLAVLPAALFSQEEGYEFRLSNFSLEFYGGASQVNPIDLNNHAAYEEAYLQFYFVKYYDYLHSIYGDNYIVTSTRTGDSQFRTLKKAVPYGFRLRYQASPTFSLTLGIQYLDGTQVSNVGMTFDIQDRRPDYIDYPNVRTIQYQNTGFTTEAKAWMPELGAQFGWDISAVFRWEISIAFGPIFTQCRTLSQRHTIVTTADGYRSDSLNATEMKGSVTGLSGEGGAGIFIRPLKYARLFIQGGYIFRELGEITGPSWNRTSVSDINGVHDATLTTWTRKWYVQTNNVNQSWGRFTPLSLQNRIDFENGMRRFNTNLSGFQVKAGLGFNF
jgi:hypothetical protein